MEAGESRRLAVRDTLMRKLLALLTGVVLVLTLGGVARTDGFNRGLISVTFDDGWTSQHGNALPTSTHAPTTTPYNLRVKFVESTTTAIVQGWIASAKASNACLILAYHEVGENIGGGTYTTDTAVLDADMKAVRDSGLGIVTVAQGAAEVLSQTSGNKSALVLGTLDAAHLLGAIL